MTMGGEVKLSKRSQELIIEYVGVCQLKSSPFVPFQTSINSAQLISWLSEDIIISTAMTQKSKQETEFILASLRAELLRDLAASMDAENISGTDKEENVSFEAQLKLIFLALAGTLLAGCEGFDSITTMLSVLSLPSVVTLLAGLSFSILSVIVFFSYDLIQVSKNLGVTLIDAPKLLDVYLLQMNEIKHIRKIIDSYKLAQLSLKELNQLESIIIMLQKRFKTLADTSSQFECSINSSQIQIAKTIISGLAGLLFFGSGFFAGQSVAMFVASLFVPVVLPTFWPVLLFSAAVGLASFSLYWYVELVGLKKLVSGWFGLDEEKIDELCDKKVLDKEEKKLDNLLEKLLSTAKLSSKLAKFQEAWKNISEERLKQLESHSAKNHGVGSLVSSNNIYSFHSAKSVPQNNFSIDIADFGHGLACS